MLHRPRVALLALLVLSAVLDCRDQQGQTNTTTAEEKRLGVLLSGEFRRVAKAAYGRAEVVRQGQDYTLKLSQARVEAKGPIRVYWVGVEHASTTRAVVEAGLKYDMAELEQGSSEQIIELPSKPDPALRSVVLWHPTYAINLAYAPLRAADAHR